MWHVHKKPMAKRSKGRSYDLSRKRWGGGGVGADLVCEWDAIGHLVDVLPRVEVVALVKAPAQLWGVVEKKKKNYNQWVSSVWQPVSVVKSCVVL